MHHTLQSSVLVLLLTLGGAGCDHSSPEAPVSTDPPAPSIASEQQQSPDATQEAEPEVQQAEAPKPSAAPLVPDGWTRGEPQPLPTDSHGLTVAYEHESGLAVTLYQLTRGYTSITNDLDSPLVQKEMRRAKDGIKQAVIHGYWQAAKEVQSKKVNLGASQQEALWSQYHITDGGVTLVSDIYIWSRANTLFKLRCTSRAEGITPNQTVLDPLLTMLGSVDPADPGIFNERY